MSQIELLERIELHIAAIRDAKSSDDSEQSHAERLLVLHASLLNEIQMLTTVMKGANK